MGKSETTIQIQFVQRVKWLYPEYSDLCFAIPNGGKRDAKTAMVLKNMGVTGGVPDVFIAVPKRGRHGLFIELKKPGGRLSSDQERIIDQLERQGYDVEVFDDVELAFDYLTDYLQ